MRCTFTYGYFLESTACRWGGQESEIFTLALRPEAGAAAVSPRKLGAFAFLSKGARLDMSSCAKGDQKATTAQVRILLRGSVLFRPGTDTLTG